MLRQLSIAGSVACLLVGLTACGNDDPTDVTVTASASSSSATATTAHHVPGTNAPAPAPGTNAKPVAPTATHPRQAPPRTTTTAARTGVPEGQSCTTSDGRPGVTQAQPGDASGDSSLCIPTGAPAATKTTPADPAGVAEGQACTTEDGKPGVTQAQPGDAAGDSSLCIAK